MFISGLAGTFLSGADTALLYETAVAEGGAQAGQKALATASALTVGALALAPALAGFLYQWHMWAPAVAKGITALITLAVVWGIKEQPVEREEHIGLVGQMSAAIAILRGNRWALSLVLFGWVYNTAMSMMSQYGQAYMPFMGLTMGATGIVYALSQGSGTLGNTIAGRLGRVTGGRLLRFGPLFAGGFILAMGIAGGLRGGVLLLGLPLAALAGALCFVLTGVSDGLFYPIHQHRLNEAIPSAQRATILSLESAGTSMFMTVAFPAASYLTIPHIYLATGAVTLVVAVVWMARRWSY
jgi:MFS family permease